MRRHTLLSAPHSLVRDTYANETQEPSLLMCLLYVCERCSGVIDQNTDYATRPFKNSSFGLHFCLLLWAHGATWQGFKESKVDEETRQESLDHVGFLFAYISDKDIFHKYYSKLLSKRIIQLTSVSDEAEERMLKNMRKVRRGNHPPSRARVARMGREGWEHVHVPTCLLGVAADRLSVADARKGQEVRRRLAGYVCAFRFHRPTTTYIYSPARK